MSETARSERDLDEDLEKALARSLRRNKEALDRLARL